MAVDILLFIIMMAIKMAAVERQNISSIVRVDGVRSEYVLYMCRGAV
jgi:hypothetical protein